MQMALFDVTSRRTVPQVFVDGNFIGGADGALALGSTLHTVSV